MSGAVISLTPRIEPTVDRQAALNEYAEFKDADDMIQQLNSILSKPHGFPPIPAPRKAWQVTIFEAKKRHSQYVMCPEQDCENPVYFDDQTRSMIETLDLHQHPFWKERVEKFYQWYNQSASRTSKDAWTWEGGKDISKWSSTRGASRRNHSVPANPADRQRRRQFNGEILTQATATSIRRVKQIRNAQFQRMTILRRSTSSRTCSGSRRLLVLIEGLPRILDCIAHTVTWTTIWDSHASTLTSIKSRMRSIDARCAQAITLHFYAPRHRSKAVKESPIGARLSTSVQSKVGNLIIDGEKQQLMSSQTFPF